MEREKTGLIGHPLGHSCSPRLHELLGGRGYTLWDTAPDALDEWLRSGEFTGANVTIPYKQTVIPYCTELSATAREIGAVNTLVRRPDGLYGDNTDAYGFAALARRAGVSFAGRKVLVLGDGGTSRTARYVIRSQGGTPVIISLEGEDNYENIGRHADAQVIVNTTPVGMYPKVEGALVDLAMFPQLEGVLDVVYNPLRTRLILQAQEMGLPCAGGLYMLCGQAARAREVFTGKSVSDEALAAAYGALLRERQSLVLIGMPGCGKSTMGKLLEKRLHMPLVDVDAEIVKKIGCDIPAYFREQGEEAFRRVESEVISSLTLTGGRIIACGGGAVLREDNRKNLRMNGRVVWIQRALDKLPVAGRPVSQSAPSLQALYDARRALYQACADAAVENNGEIENCVEQIIRAYQE